MNIHGVSVEYIACLLTQVSFIILMVPGTVINMCIDIYRDVPALYSIKEIRLFYCTSLM